MMQTAKNEYLLGANEAELERLRFQHWVWKKITDNFLDRVGVKEGWKCLDVGAGPGFTSMDLRDRVGSSGEVTALDPSDYYLNFLREQTSGKGWANFSFIQGRAEDADVPIRHFDFIFVRWVIAFVPNPEKFLKHLLATLRPGGIIALQDYWYEGLSMYPLGTALGRLPDLIRAYYKAGGGDPYVTGKIPELLRSFKTRTIDFSPHQLAGGPQSDVWRWADKFFRGHLPLMTAKGIITNQGAEEILASWSAQQENPNALFFSPIVVDIAGELST